MDEVANHRKTTERHPRHAQGTPENLAAMLNQMYDVHRVSALNSAYFAWKVEQINSWTLVYEGALAVTTALTAGSGLSNLFFLPEIYVKILTAVLATISALLAAVKPTLGLGRRLEMYTKQYLGYNRVFTQLDKMIREIAERQSVDAQSLASWKATRERYFELKAADPTYVNRAVLDRVSNDILQRYPAEYYWVP